MSDINFVIETYVISFHFKTKPIPSASILLFGKQKSEIVQLNFVDSHAEVLPAYFANNFGMYRAYYHKDRLPEVMDILRNEKPLSCATSTRSELFGHVYIYSGAEPIGEGEFN